MAEKVLIVPRGGRTAGVGVGNEQGPRVSQSPLEKPLGGGGGGSDVCVHMYMGLCVSMLPAAVEWPAFLGTPL